MRKSAADPEQPNTHNQQRKDGSVPALAGHTQGNPVPNTTAGVGRSSETHGRSKASVGPRAARLAKAKRGSCDYPGIDSGAPPMAVLGVGNARSTDHSTGDIGPGLARAATPLNPKP